MVDGTRFRRAPGARFIEQALAICAVDPRDACSLGYTARILTIATLPHRAQPGDCYERTSGGYRLIVQAVPGMGLPYGSYPRLLLAWLTTQIVRTRQRELDLGPSMAGFLRGLGLHANGGRGCTDARSGVIHSAGMIVRLKRQIASLFSSRFILHNVQGGAEQIELLPVGDSVQVWHDTPFEDERFPTRVRVSEPFFEHVIRGPVPVDLRALRALKRSPLALDLYTWLTHRNYLLQTGSRAATLLPWSALQVQFGADYPHDSRGRADFKKAFYEAYRRVRLVYPDARLRDAGDAVDIVPSAPHIRPRAQRV